MWRAFFTYFYPILPHLNAPLTYDKFKIDRILFKGGILPLIQWIGKYSMPNIKKIYFGVKGAIMGFYSLMDFNLIFKGLKISYWQGQFNFVWTTY